MCSCFFLTEPHTASNKQVSNDMWWSKSDYAYRFAQAGVIDCVCLRKTISACAKKNPSRKRNVFYLTTHSTHFIYGYMASDIWLRTILIVRKETRCRHIGYSYRFTAKVLLYMHHPTDRITHHDLCYTSRGALAGTRNSSMGPPHEGSIRQPIAPWVNALPLSYVPLPNPIKCWCH